MDLIHGGLDAGSDVHQRVRCAIEGEDEGPNGVVDVDVVTGLLTVSEHHRLPAGKER